MPWEVKDAVEQREQLVGEYEIGESIAELSRRYRVSRQTIYKWIERWEANREAGLQDRSRAPHHHPQQCAEGIRSQVLELRYAHARWGPRKLRAFLNKQQPNEKWPATSTIGEWLRQEGLAQRRRARRRTPPMSQPLAHATEPNQLWCADFKGWFLVQDGDRVDPLTMTDAATRYLLRCTVVEKTNGTKVRAVMEAAFREYGMPEAIRTDNGPPFASVGPAGLSRLSMWWIRLGIRPERIEPGEPQQNGAHERFHLTLKQETASPPHANRVSQQRAFGAFQKVYNEQRPHEALQYETPASRYVASARQYPARLPDLAFPTGAVMRRVSGQGSIRWRGERTFISEVLGHETVGLCRVSDDYWQMYYGPVAVGWFESRHRRFYPAHRPPKNLETDQG